MMVFQLSWAQISGVVVDEKNEPIPGSTVSYENTFIGTITDPEGKFNIPNPPEEANNLVVSCVGFETHVIALGTNKSFKIVLKEDERQLDEVTIIGQSSTDRMKSQGFTVESISVESLKNTNVDINQVLSTVSGVNVRQAGGLGSNVALSLNGISGNRVRYFMDGIPMENFGSSFNLNNFPANLIRRIEVFKGVVPVGLAGDALGGAINIITPSLQNQFMDVSYSLGSFNTHRATFFFQKVTKRGIIFKLSSFYNYSDNDYWMDNVPNTDDFGNVLGSMRVRRFHDQYESGLINFRSGVINKSYADELTLNINYAANSNNIQHPDASINRVYGGRNVTNTTLLLNGRYKKAWDNLELDINSLIGESSTSTYDTLMKRFNWSEEFTEINTAEEAEARSIYNLDDKINSTNAGLTYSYNEHYEFVLKYNTNFLERSESDDLNERIDSLYNTPSDIKKDVLGFSLDYESKSGRIKYAAFVKNYWYHATIYSEEFSNESQSYEWNATNTGFTKTGFGIATSYQLSPVWLLKTSYEKAYRLPEPTEVLGDGVNILRNPDLQPEQSNNINLGLSYTKSGASNAIKSETNFFYRPTKGYIRPIPRGVIVQNENDDNVGILGMETSNSYTFSSHYTITANLTYQDLRDQTDTDQGLQNTNKGDRIGNEPYLFGNLQSAYRKGAFSTSWLINYVHEFYLYSEENGNEDTNRSIPQQLTHDINLNYALKDGRYNISFSMRNVLDAEAYDNFSIQKPGRAFYFKFRYYVDNF